MNLSRNQMMAYDKYLENPTQKERDKYIVNRCGNECERCERFKMNGGECFGAKTAMPCLGMIKHMRGGVNNDMGKSRDIQLQSQP